MTTVYRFKAAFTKSGDGFSPTPAPTLTVVDFANNILVNAAAVTALTNLAGVYVYEYSGADGLDLVGRFRTTDATVDEKDLYSYTPAILTNTLNATVSSRSSHSAADVWTVSVRSLTTFGTLVADVWAYVTRTLTMTAIQINAAITGSIITIKRGDTVQVDITGLGDLSARTALYFTAKRYPAIATSDDTALLKISEAGNLLKLNGANAPTPADATMTVVDQVTGHVRLMFYPGATKMLPIITGVPYDIQMEINTNVYTKTESTLTVSVDVTRS